MSPAEQRYEVSQIFAEAQATGMPLKLACIAAVLWFDKHGLNPPTSILEWLAEVPQDQWRPSRVH